MPGLQSPTSRSLIAWCGVLIACTVVAAWVGVWRGFSAGVVVSLVGVPGAGALLVLLAGIARLRDERAQALAEASSRLLEAAESGQRGRADDDAVGLALEALREGTAVLRARVPDLQRSREATLAVFEGVSEAVVATDARGDVFMANAQARALMGERARQVGTPNIEEVFTQSEILSLHAAAQGGQRGSARVRITRDGKPRTFDAAGVPLAMPGGPSGVVLTLRDVSELATAVQLKTDFVANASHEFRTPLASIRAAVETMDDGGGDDPAMRARLSRMITSNVTRLEELVRDLLDLSRLESPDAPVQVAEVSLRELVEDLQPLFAEVCSARRLEIIYEPEGGIDRVRTDPKLLGLILKNLIDNATKFAFEETPVRVVASRVASSRPGGAAMLRFRVIDRGIGIPLGQQQRIFERFYQVDQARTGPTARRGTGLGLAIVKHAVRRLEGSIKVDSVWKQGTTMIVEIPEGAPA